MTTAPLHRRRREATFTNMRKVANLLVLIGYYVLLNVDITTGVSIRVVSALMVLPWMVDKKVWDGAFVMSIMLSIDIHKLIELLFL